MSEQKLVRVRDVMKQNFDLVDGMDTVQTALETMMHVETKSLIVKKRHKNDEFGMVLLSDIARQVAAGLGDQGAGLARLGDGEAADLALVGGQRQVELGFSRFGKLHADLARDRVRVIIQRSLLEILGHEFHLWKRSERI